VKITGVAVGQGDVNTNSGLAGIASQVATMSALNSLVVIAPVLFSTLIVCEAVALFPQASIAVQVRVIE
jgi:hypothetical protein